MDTNFAAPLANTYWVIPGLVLAGEHPGESDRDVVGKKLDALLEAGIRTFIDLTDEDEINEDAKLVPSYRPQLRTLTDERRIDITFMRIPIQDRDVPSVWTMRRILDAIDESVADENPVFVHCWAGRGRTGAVVGCLLKRRGLATDEDVVHKIMELRRLMPTGRESSPHTSEQIRMVKNWKPGV